MPPAARRAAKKILSPPPGGSPGLTGSFMAPTLTEVRTAAAGLPLTRAALLLEPPLAARLGRLGGAPRARHVERAREPFAQPLERELAIARLPACVLGHRGHARPAARHDAALLLVAERLRRLNVEHRLDARGGHVGVLPARPGRAARAQLDLLEGDVDAARDLHR